MKKKLNTLTTIELIQMLLEHNQLFYAPYAETEEELLAMYMTRKIILDILTERNEQQCTHIKVVDK
jgi:hypothetical protein